VIGLESALAWLLLGIAALALPAYVAWPLWRALRLHPPFERPAADPPGQPEACATLLAALAELDRDRELGNLTAADHARLRSLYERRGRALGVDPPRPAVAADDEVVA
jgi:hypothetical protein